MRVLLAIIVAVIALCPAAARPASSGAGAYLSLGDGGYAALSLYGDLRWRRGDLSPYAWTELLADDYINQITLGGGTWLDVSPAARLKAGLGLSAGRLKEWDDSSSSVLIELGAERDFAQDSLFGGELRVTRGRLPGARGAAVREELIEAGRRQRRVLLRSPPELDTFTTTELAAYLQKPWREVFLRPRVAVIRAEGDSILSLGLACLLPRGDNTFSAGITLESGDADAVYLTFGLYHRFL